MHWLGLTSNIMSLGGIAIAIGAMVDAAIIMVENAHKQLEHFREAHCREPDRVERARVIIAAAQSVGRPLFFSLLVITVSFIPVFSLQAQEGRLFSPLAFTKTFAMLFAALLGVTLVPVADAGVHSRQDHAGSPQPDSTVSHLDLPTLRGIRLALSLAGDPRGHRRCIVWNACADVPSHLADVTTSPADLSGSIDPIPFYKFGSEFMHSR